MANKLTRSLNPKPLKALLAQPNFWKSPEKIFVRKASALRHSGRPDDALMLIDRLAKKRADISLKTAHLLKHIKAECLFDKKYFREAISVYDTILSEDEDPAAYANRGLAYWELKAYKKASGDYTKAVALRPNDAVALVSIGQLLTKRGEHAKSIPYLKRAVRLNPNSTRALCALGISYYNTKDWLQAQRALTRAVEIDPENHVAQLGKRKIEDHFGL